MLKPLHHQRNEHQTEKWWQFIINSTVQGYHVQNLIVGGTVYNFQNT